MNQIDPNKLPKSLVFVCKALRNAGFQGWLVGGAVRDLLMGRKPHDFDIATDALPYQVEDLFNTAVSHTIDTGKKHGTITVFFPSFNLMNNDIHQYEVTTFRTDSTYSDGRHPDSVQFVSSIKEDLARRDFCMNAIACDIEGNIFDPFSGQSDIQDKIISTVNYPNDRFKEDGLRCLRAIRFAAQLGFTIEKWTFDAIRPNMKSFEKVSYERIASELLKIFECNSDRVAVAFTHLMMSGIMDVILPEMQPMMYCEQNCYHEFDVMNHTICVLSHVKDDAPVHVKLSALFHDVGKPATQQLHEKRGDFMFLNHEEVSADMTYEIMTRLKFSNELRDKVCHLIRHHLVMYESKWSNATIRRWVRRIGIDNVDDLLDLYRADIMGKGNAIIKQSVDSCEELRERVRQIRETCPIVTSTTQLAINGKDIMERFQLPPGKHIGDRLKACVELVTENPEANTADALINFLCCGYEPPKVVD